MCLSHVRRWWLHDGGSKQIEALKVLGETVLFAEIQTIVLHELVAEYVSS